MYIISILSLLERTCTSTCEIYNCPAGFYLVQYTMFIYFIPFYIMNLLILESKTKKSTSTSMDELLAQQPPIPEIAAHARTAESNHLGVIL